MTDMILHGNALERAKELADESVNCIVTSPPYYGLRDYGVTGQIGLEESPEQYIEKLVTLFRELRRVLKKDGTFWLNLGDSYVSKPTGHDGANTQLRGGSRTSIQASIDSKQKPLYKGLPEKNLMMIPARVAIALQSDGWYLRSQIIWHKPNCMPESVKDRPTNDYEMVYLLTKSSEYFYDADAIREHHKELDKRGYGGVEYNGKHGKAFADKKVSSGTGYLGQHPNGRNKRAVWSINTRPYLDAHFATMPQELADTCIKAGCPKGGIVLDPFGGAGTTAISAISLKRHYILIELNADYIAMAQKRIDYAKIQASQLELFGDLL